MSDFMVVKQTKESLNRQLDCYRQLANYSIRHEFGGVTIGLLIVTSLLLPLYLVTADNDWVKTKGVFTMLVVLLWIVALPVISWQIIKRVRLNNQIKEAVQTEMNTAKEYQMRFDEDGIVQKFDTATVDFKWSHFSYYAETGSTIYLFIHQSSFTFVAVSNSEIGVENFEKLKSIAKTKLPMLDKRIKLKDRM